MQAVRGACDFLALTHRYHDARIHRRCAPQRNPGRDIFGWLEDARIAAIGARMLEGVALNLDAELEAGLRKAFLDTVARRDSAPFGIAIGLLVRERLSGRPLPPAAQRVASFWRDEILAQAGDSLDRLQASLFDQGRYAEEVLRMLALLGFDCTPDEQAPATMQDGSEADEEAGGEDEQAPREAEAGQSGAGVQKPDSGVAAVQQEQAALADADAPASTWSSSIAPDGAIDGYRVHTREFDRIARAEDLCGPDELDRFRTQLDQKLAPLRPAILKLANRLQNKLLAKQKSRWMADLDEGMLDYARLASLLVEGSDARAYRQEQIAASLDTVLTILIDCSGSMRGKPIMTAAMCADVLGRALERCSVRVEILGFTTQDWRGGQSRRQWAAAGKAERPGRLNDLLHLVFKGADEPWRKGRRRLGLCLQEELLKENVDGEALLWAHERLMSRPEARRILMVISDGVPADTSTRMENGASYLERHLRDAIARMEKRAAVELVAIGIGHDVACYYRHAVRISHPDQLGMAMAERLAALFDVEDRPRHKGAGSRKLPASIADA